MFTKKFLTALAERAFKTYCQVTLAAITAAGSGLIDTDWVGIGSVGAMAALASILTSFGTSVATGNDSPSLGAETLK